MTPSAWMPLLDHLVPALLVMFRLGGLMLYGPVFGSPAIPGRVKIMLCVLLGLAIYPALSDGPLAEVSVSNSMWLLPILIALETMVGVIIGFIASIPLIAVQTGGLIMGQQMGLGFAQFYNPAVDDEADVVGQLLFFLALAGFLLIGGHEHMVLAVLRSFEYVPLGGLSFDSSIVVLLAGLLTASFELALRIAAPLLTVIFLESAAMGFLSKTVPQLNILSLGFPIRILVGLGIIALGLTILNETILEFTHESFDALARWIEGKGG